MSPCESLTDWITTVSSQMPHLSRPQARVLALWSYGMVMAQSCGLTTVATVLGLLLHQSPLTLRQRLREWCYAAADKKGRHRQDVPVASCFGPLLRWVLAWWPAEERRRLLAMDATTLGQRFTVLAISVVYRGCAIPVAWTVVVATEKGAWRPHWEGLFTQLRGSVPADWCVLVLADRGLYASWLYQAIVALDWHPFLRINQGGQYRRLGQQRFRPLRALVPTVGTSWSGRVDCFVTAPLRCTLLASWSAGHRDPWLILTDLPPRRADVAWYSLRTWIEAGFKDVKRGGWQWQQTKMTDPERATRLWLAMAVATLWVVSVGGAVEVSEPASMRTDRPLAPRTAPRTRRSTRPRLLSCFRQGVLAIHVALLHGQPLPVSRFIPEPWPSTAAGWTGVRPAPSDLAA